MGIGGGVQGLGVGLRSMEVTGVVCIFVSMVAGSQRWAMIQMFMQRTAQSSSKLSFFDKLWMVAIMKPIDCFFCLMLSRLWERPNFTAVSSELVKMWCIIGQANVLIVICDLVIVQRTSAVGFGVVDALCKIPLVLSGVLVNKEHVTWYEGIGFMICLVGAFLYFRARARSLAVSAAL